jgi:cation:H+ antiporter
MIVFFGLVLGLSLLIGGGFLLVKGSSGIATRLNVSPIIVGLTIIAFGTSAPELVIGIFAALRDQSDIVFGNAVGSNIANLGLVLGIAAVIRPIEINGKIVLRELPLLLLATGVIVVMALDPILRGVPATLDRSDAIILLLLFFVFFYVTALDVLHRRRTDPLLADIDSSPLVAVASPATYDWASVALGLIGLFFGGQLTISNGVQLSTLLGVPSTIVGLFVVAVGTSLPELVTSVIAAIRREPDLALGNVIGSNLFNSLAALPISAIIRPVDVPNGGMFDLSVSFLFAAVLIPIFWIGRARLGRRVGWLLLFGYGVYALGRIL